VRKDPRPASIDRYLKKDKETLMLKGKSLTKPLDSLKSRQPDPSFVWELLVDIDRCPKDAIFAGDSETDMETARAAGCYPLGIGWGFRTREELEAAGAARVINRPDELLEILGSR
jgi:phosphoglycolate phosphatase-like HAD superfamily hydrolase